MLEQVDASLSAWLGGALPREVEIAFAPPDDPADAAARGTVRRHRGPVVNLFLHDVEAEDAALSGAPIRSRARDSADTYAHLPARRYRLAYLVTAIADDPGTEHRLLGAILRLHARSDLLPDACLQGELRTIDVPLPLFIARAGRTAPPQYFRSELGTRLRASLALEIVVPVRPEPVLEPAPPVRRVDLGSELASPPGAPAMAGRPRQEHITR